MLNTIANVGVVLELFTRERPEWGVTELAEQTKLPKSNVHALVDSLAEIGLLTRTPRKRYRLGWRLLVLSDRMQDASGIKEQALPYMERLAADLREAVMLSVPLRDHALYIARTDGMHPIVRLAGIRVGSKLPLYCTAVGKVFLSAMEPSEAIERLNGVERKQRTAHTITSVEGLMERVALVRREGVAYDRCECVNDACCVAVPLFDPQGHVIAALSVSMPAYRYERSVADVTAQLLAGSERINELISESMMVAPTPDRVAAAGVG